MEIIGKVVKLGNLMNGTSARGPWQKQELIIETDEQYPKNGLFELLERFGQRSCQSGSRSDGQGTNQYRVA